MPNCSAPAFELACYLTVRRKTFNSVAFFACQSVATVCVVLLPLFVTNTASCGAARVVCYDRTIVMANVTSFDVDSPHYDPEWDMKDFAPWNLFPAHLFNSIAAVVSLFGFWAWLFFSPHKFDVAQNLDRRCTKPDLFLKEFKHATTLLFKMFSFTVGSYFALQWLANVRTAAVAIGSSCAQSATANMVIFFVNLLAGCGLSVVGTNLLCHRYLVEKARVVIKLCGTQLFSPPTFLYFVSILLSTM
jgi:hypothetical protein